MVYIVLYTYIYYDIQPQINAYGNSWNDAVAIAVTQSVPSFHFWNPISLAKDTISISI